jgi:hypothetical protein
VNFNGTGTVAIRASGNVSSITDHGTGNYTVNFATAMPDANYSACTGFGGASTFGLAAIDQTTPRTTTAMRFASFNSVGSGIDAAFESVAIFR